MKGPKDRYVWQRGTVGVGCQVAVRRMQSRYRHAAALVPSQTVESYSHARPARSYGVHLRLCWAGRLGGWGGTGVLVLNQSSSKLTMCRDKLGRRRISGL